MRNWKRVLLINLGMFAGWMTSVFLVPRDTRFWPFVVIAAGYIAIIDVDLAISIRRGEIRMPIVTKMLIIIFVLWLVELISRRVFA